MTVDTTTTSGAPANPAQEAFKTEGMSCVSCVSRIEKRLKKLPGVVDARVNLASEKATVEYTPGVVSRADFRRAVEAAGYQVVEEQPRTGRQPSR